MKKLILIIAVAALFAGCDKDSISYNQDKCEEQARKYFTTTATNESEIVFSEMEQVDWKLNSFLGNSSITHFRPTKKTIVIANWLMSEYKKEHEDDTTKTVCRNILGAFYDPNGVLGDNYNCYSYNEIIWMFGWRLSNAKYGIYTEKNYMMKCEYSTGNLFAKKQVCYFIFNADFELMCPPIAEQND